MPARWRFPGREERWARDGPGARRKSPFGLVRPL